MTPTESESQQGKWFLAWWGILPTHLFTSRTKGSREEAWKEWKKLNPDRELCATIGEYTKKREKHWQAEIDRNVKMTSWKHAVRLLRYRFWEDDEILESGHKRERGAMDLCACGNEITHASGTCWTCYRPAEKDWRDAMIDGMLK